MKNTNKPARRVRGEAKLGMNRKEALWKDLVDSAEAGDESALRIVADRVWPKLKPVSPPINFEYKGDKISDKMNSVIAAVAGGLISPCHVKPLIDALEMMRRNRYQEDSAKEKEERKALANNRHY